MDGVDLLDSFLSHYRKRMICRRWYMYLFWHTTYIGMINAWLIYKRECVVIGVPKRDVVIRRRFQAALASTLVEGNGIPRRRGRSSLEGDDRQDGAC